jgi:hypothetical protein
VTRQISLKYYNLCCVDGYSTNISELYVTQQDAIHEVYTDIGCENIRELNLAMIKVTTVQVTKLPL